MNANIIKIMSLDDMPSIKKCEELSRDILLIIISQYASEVMRLQNEVQHLKSSNNPSSPEKK